MTNLDLANGSGKGTPSQGNGTDGKAVDGAADPFSGLETGTREWVGTKGYKSVGDLAKAAQSAEGLIGRSVQLPADDAKPEDIAKFVQKATAKYRPDKPEGYEFKLPEGVPKEMPYDGDGAKEFKGIAHELGLTATQAQRAHDWFVSRQAGAFKAEADKLVKTAGDATSALEKTWGKADSDAFKQNVELAVTGIKQTGGDELFNALKEAKLIGPGDIVLSPTIALAFAKVGQMFAEDKLISPNGGAAGNNPFAAGKENMTEQSRLAKADPDKARRLIRQAGREGDFPSLFKAKA